MSNLMPRLEWKSKRKRKRERERDRETERERERLLKPYQGPQLVSNYIVSHKAVNTNQK
jgi:hypothetical protein